MSAPDISRKEKYSRCVALEEDYVHQVYEQIGKDLAQAKDPLQKTVKNFLDELEPGSLVADVGCGDGRHLRSENGIFSLGADNSCLQTTLARQRYQEAILGDNLRLPFRGNAFDAVLSVGVIHHFTTKERRIRALKELSRILKIGGRVLIAVQRNNTQISPDVLIPWFDVPKTKRIKERHWLDQDSGEYELEDDKDDDEDEDEDSLSLSSSDEDDAPLTNFAKFFPPQTHHAKIGWNSDRQSRSLDYDYQTHPSNVPNSKQLVQTNVCYAFVRKAFKRFSSVNSSDEDPYFVNDLLRRADSAVPPSPASGIEQKFDLLQSSSFDQENEIEQKVIRDNFIELLNIDDDQDSSRSSRNRIYTNETFSRSNSKSPPPSKNKSNLIRSLSGMFRNVNSLWSSKSTKSCSDLKSQAVLGENALQSKGSRERRLVRSITTATCNPEFDYNNTLENIEEFDMTVGEANNIVDVFLESSMPRIETVQATSKSKNDIITSLNHSDIVNGNALPVRLKNSVESLSPKSKLYNYPNQAETLNFNPISKERACDSTNLKHKYDNRKEVSFKELKKLKKDENLEYSDSCHYFSTSFSKEYFLNESLNNFNPNYEYSDLKQGYSTSNSNTETGKPITSRDSLSCGTKNSLCKKNLCKTDRLQNYAMQNTTSMGNHENSSYNLSKSGIKISLVSDKPATSTASVNSEIIKDIGIKNINQNKISQIRVCDDTFSNTNSQQITTSSEKSLPEYASENKNQIKVTNIKDSCQINNPNYKCLLQNSPKRLRKFNQNYNYQMAGSKTLGPFYEECDDFEMEQDSCLSSYYSMPELHALSEFYQEYNVYQNYVVDHTDIKLQTLGNCSTKNLDYILIDETKESSFEPSNNEIITDNDSILHMSEDKYLQHKTSNANTCITNLNKDICNSFQSAFTGEHLSAKKADTLIIPSDALTPKNFENCKNISSKSIFQNLPLEFINSDKCRSLTSINSNSLWDPINKFHSKNTINRSRSIDIIHTRYNSYDKTLTEIDKSSNILLDQVSFDVFLNNKDKSNFNLNSQKILKELCNSNSIEVFSNKCEKCPIREGRIAGERDHNTNLNKCAFRTTNECFEISTNEPFEKNYTDLNSLKKGLGSKDITRNSSEENYQNSISNSPILSKKFPSPSSEIKNEFMKKHMEENGCTVLSESEIKDIFMSKTIRHVKMYEQENEKDCHLPTLLSELKYPSDSPVDQYLAKNKIDFKKSYEFDTNLFEENFMDRYQETLSETKYSSCEKDEGSYLQSESKERKMKNFSVQNISITQPIVFPLRSVDSISNEKDSDNGATTNKESKIRTKLKDILLTDSSDSIDTSSDLKTSKTIDFIGSNSFQTAEKMENNSSDCKFPHDDKIDYSYGWIHEQDAAVIGHRYHHLFEEEELDELIQDNISDLHVLNSFHEETHWCVIAEKVRVWTI